MARIRNKMIPETSCSICGIPYPLAELVEQDGFLRCIHTCVDRYSEEDIDQMAAEAEYPTPDAVFGGRRRVAVWVEQ